MIAPPETKRAAPDRATRVTTTDTPKVTALPSGAQADVAPAAIADGIIVAQAALWRATRALRRASFGDVAAQIAIAERSLALAQWAAQYCMAEDGSC